MKRAALSLGLIMLATAAPARDDGRYANSPLKSWFESLSSEFGPCCSPRVRCFMPGSMM